MLNNSNDFIVDGYKLHVSWDTKYPNAKWVSYHRLDGTKHYSPPETCPVCHEFVEDHFRPYTTGALGPEFEWWWCSPESRELVKQQKERAKVPMHITTDYLKSLSADVKINFCPTFEYGHPSCGQCAPCVASRVLLELIPYVTFVEQVEKELRNPVVSKNRFSSWLKEILPN